MQIMNKWLFFLIFITSVYGKDSSVDLNLCKYPIMVNQKSEHSRGKNLGVYYYSNIRSRDKVNFNLPEFSVIGFSDYLPYPSQLINGIRAKNQKNKYSKNKQENIHAHLLNIRRKNLHRGYKEQKEFQSLLNLNQANPFFEINPLELMAPEQFYLRISDLNIKGTEKLLSYFNLKKNKKEFLVGKHIEFLENEVNPNLLEPSCKKSYRYKLSCGEVFNKNRVQELRNKLEDFYNSSNDSFNNKDLNQHYSDTLGDSLSFSAGCGLYPYIKIYTGDEDSNSISLSLDEIKINEKKINEVNDFYSEVEALDPLYKKFVDSLKILYDDQLSTFHTNERELVFAIYPRNIYGSVKYHEDRISADQHSAINTFSACMFKKVQEKQLYKLVSGDYSRETNRSNKEEQQEDKNINRLYQCLKNNGDDQFMKFSRLYDSYKKSLSSLNVSGYKISENDCHDIEGFRLGKSLSSDQTESIYQACQNLKDTRSKLANLSVDLLAVSNHTCTKYIFGLGAGINYGDMSSITNPIGGTEGHSGHREGRDIDIRPFRKIFLPERKVKGRTERSMLESFINARAFRKGNEDLNLSIYSFFLKLIQVIEPGESLNDSVLEKLLCDDYLILSGRKYSHKKIDEDADGRSDKMDIRKELLSFINKKDLKDFIDKNIFSENLGEKFSEKNYASIDDAYFGRKDADIKFLFSEDKNFINDFVKLIEKSQFLNQSEYLRWKIAIVGSYTDYSINSYEHSGEITQGLFEYLKSPLSIFSNCPKGGTFNESCIRDYEILKDSEMNKAFINTLLEVGVTSKPRYQFTRSYRDRDAKESVNSDRYHHNHIHFEFDLETALKSLLKSNGEKSETNDNYRECARGYLKEHGISSK
jgi:hypothetical protein